MTFALAVYCFNASYFFLNTFSNYLHYCFNNKNSLKYKPIVSSEVMFKLIIAKSPQKTKNYSNPGSTTKNDKELT